ncbi:2ed61336-c5c5-4340-ab1c-4ca208159de1 [Sclerotinia trifoliorum]|uniref:2ed61336-c5c5-4340-ab1c-4ca208159de1 n=1 Tax=Sclerotinia trifoliorum TaxID=28548 RepID=A0A8H2ZRN1_9HELO|nr:2ed61336-c5c5-4340-ab1c-4ca208159de1 [Sclerotinia trifoliorum]
MADRSLNDRQDVPIWNAIEAGNFKQALKLLDKRLAKKRTSHLEAFKIYIRSRSSVQSERDVVLPHLEDLVNKKVIITDQEDIDLYDDALVNAIPEAGSIWARTIGELRWQCVKAYPKQEDSALKSFKACLSERDWEHAQQIASSLEKTFPSKHQYVFWNISSLFLRSMSTDLPIEKRTLWGRLAFGQISKLATATIQADKSKSLPTRAIHTPQELLLLQRITAAHGKLEDQLKYLNEPSLGPESIVAKGDWELWRNKLQLMEASQHWEQLFETTSGLLKRARTKDERGHIIDARMADWAVWQAYLRSALALQSPSALDSVSNEIAAHLDPTSGIDKTWRRNASLAWLDFTFKTSSTAFAREDSGPDVEKYPRVTAIVKYLQDFGDATTAYSDLRPYLELSQTDERLKLLEIFENGLQFGKKAKENDLESEFEALSISKNEFDNANDMTRCVNLHKLNYLVMSSIPEHERRSNPLHKVGQQSFICTYCSSPCEVYCDVCLQQLSKNSIAAYTSAMSDDRVSKSLLPTDRHPADDFCTLAAMCLMKLSLSGSSDVEGPLNSKKIAYALQAAVFLEYGWSKSKSNSDFALILVRIYSSLGCGQQAMKAYLHLSLKQIQLDTLGYIILDRISSMHPHPFPTAPDGSSENLKPLDHLKNQRKMYRNCRHQVSNNTWKAFEHGSYNTIFQFQEFSNIITKTSSAVSSAVETTKISRLLKQDAPSDVFDILPKNPEMLDKFSDSNDYTSFPDYESTLGTGLEELTRFAPSPSSNRSRVDLLVEKLISIISPESTCTPIDLSSFREILSRVSTELHKQAGSIKTSPDGSFLTHSETAVLEAYTDLASIITKACDPTASSAADFQTSLETSNKSLCTKLKQHLSFIEGAQNATPALWDTLHILYTAYDLASTIINATKFLLQKDLKAHKYQIEQNKALVESAKLVMEAVAEKSKGIKNGLDESGWIDRALETMEVGDSGEQLRSLVGENFIEEWAGFVVEGWRESVTGLGMLKV